MTRWALRVLAVAFAAGLATPVTAEAAPASDYAAARKLHHWLLPLCQVNFVEGNPIPCKAAMAAMGLLEEVYRLPLVSPSPGAREKVMRVLQDLKMLGAAAKV